ncbi:hypothetical protein [Spirosoma montaniterrae]|nr:hypothetical protein [Spirosoma montaniterrae]
MKSLFVCFVCLLSITAHAQNQAPTTTAPLSNTLDAFWNFNPTPGVGQAVLSLSETTIPGVSSAISDIIINQSGSNNAANLSASPQNRLQLNQSNDGNRADALLTGSGNSLLLNQTGGGNSIGIDLTGSGNNYLISQDGGDKAQFSGINQANTRMELVQKSGANTFVTDNSTLVNPFTSGVQNLRIEQSGGASMTVRHGALLTP